MTDPLHTQFATLGSALEHRVLGQQDVIHRLLVAILADGHLLLDGPPGVAKTRAALLLAHAFRGSFQRIQFTPDLLPSDLTGTSIYDPSDHQFHFHRGPLFHNFVLADEINRAPAKVQAALLEAMAEHQITAGGKTHALEDSFFVIATQNPIEEEGTYELPAAQLDRFTMCVHMGYPAAQAEVDMLDLVSSEQLYGRANSMAVQDMPQIDPESLAAARHEVLRIHLSDPVKQYIVRLVGATRLGPTADAAGTNGRELAKSLEGLIAHAVSPRGSLALSQLARSHAWLEGRDHVLPSDVQALAAEALTHRLSLSHRAVIDGRQASDIIAMLIERVPVS